MSNAMRMGKRTLAGVAAGALTLALVPFVATTTAQADPGVQVTATGAGTVSPVRFTGEAGTRNTTIPAAYVSFPKATYPTLLAAATARVKLLSAPTGTARLFVDKADGDAAPANNFVQLGSLDDTALVSADQRSGVGTTAIGLSADDSFIRIGVDTAGTYSGHIANGTDTVTFNFSTTGAPTSMTLTPATSSIPIGGTQNMAVTLLDADGNVTQPTTVDSVTVTTTRGSIATSPVNTTSERFTRGVGAVVFSGAGSAGTATVTATPLGTLGATGVTAQTASVTESGAIADDTVANLSVTAPANAINLEDAPSIDQKAQVPAGTTSVTITVDDTATATVGRTLRFRAEASAGTVNGTAFTTPVFIDVTTDANRQATLTYTLGGNATAANATLTVEQVLANDTTTGLEAKIVVTQKQPTVVGADISVSPDDTIVAQINTSTSVTVTVDDSFGSPQAGWTVQARRTSDAGALLSSGTTNASGQATVSVTNLASATAPVTEVYYFVATPPVGSPVTSADNLWINYTATGDITSLSITPSSGNAFSAASPTLTTIPAARVASGGDAQTGLVGMTQSTSDYDVATAVPDAGNGASLITFRASTSPSNATTVTVPDGVRVSSRPVDGATLWNGGSNSVTIGNDDSVYVWALETGVHDITFTSANLTVTGKIFAWNAPGDAYSVSVTPAEQAVGLGQIGTVILQVRDVFGNLVPGINKDDTGAVNIEAAGQVLLAGFNTDLNFGTNQFGETVVTFIAGTTAGQGILVATPATPAGSTVPLARAWRTPFTPPPGAPAPVPSTAVEIGVGQVPIDPAILIEGDRTNRRIQVEGVTFGLAASTEISPWIRFPGQVGFTQGVARPQITIVDTDEQIGEFVWGRNTGKRTAVQFRTADGLRSNSIIIARR